MRATELVHEAGDNAVEVDTVIETGLAKIDETGCCDRDPVQIDLCHDLALCGVERRSRVAASTSL